jgi:hypothetical protein
MSQANESLKNYVYIRHAKQSLKEQKKGVIEAFLFVARVGSTYVLFLLCNQYF